MYPGPGTGPSGKKKGGGGHASPAATNRITLSAGGYLQQLPEPPQPVPQPVPQHAEPAASRPPVGHSPTQQAQLQLAHAHVPVSQQPQQAHFGQPPPTADMKGTRPRAAQSKRPFMEKLLGKGTGGNAPVRKTCSRPRGRESGLALVRWREPSARATDVETESVTPGHEP